VKDKVLHGGGEVHPITPEISVISEITGLRVESTENGGRISRRRILRP
jgi:hypothetical protein